MIRNADAKAVAHELNARYDHARAVTLPKREVSKVSDRPGLPLKHTPTPY